MLKDYSLLRIPGPTPVPPSVQREIHRPIMSHRSEEMVNLLQDINSKLKLVFNTRDDFMLLTGSGTSGLEAAVVNITNRGDEVLVVVTGAFGERFAEICEVNEVKVHRIDVPWGEAVDPNELEQFLKKHHNIKAVFLTHCETSTGVLNSIAEVSKAVKSNSDALLVVDAVSSALGVETNIEKWKVDIYVTSSQKAMMLPPGLALVYLSGRALEVVQKNKKKTSYYFNLKTYYENIKSFGVPYTPAISLLYGLNKSLDLMKKEGLSSIFKRHRVMMKMTREAMKALDLPLLCDDDVASPTVTAVRPENFPPDHLREILDREFNLILAGGQSKLQGKVFRIGHMGYCSPMDVLQVISLIELGLIRIGKKVELGVATKVAQETYLKEVNNSN